MPAPDDTSPRGRSTLLPEQVALLDHSQLSSEQVALLDRSVWWSTSQRALGPVLGISLGLVLAARAQAARRRLAQAFSGERPTLVQFANGRVRPSAPPASARSLLSHTSRAVPGRSCTTHNDPVPMAGRPHVRAVWASRGVARLCRLLLRRHHDLHLAPRPGRRRLATRDRRQREAEDCAAPRAPRPAGAQGGGARARRREGGDRRGEPRRFALARTSTWKDSTMYRMAIITHLSWFRSQYHPLLSLRLVQSGRWAPHTFVVFTSFGRCSCAVPTFVQQGLEVAYERVVQIPHAYIASSSRTAIS
jgi:hypothetical protein